MFKFPLHHPLILWLWATAFSKPQLLHLYKYEFKIPILLISKVDYEIQMVFCNWKCLVIAIMWYWQQVIGSLSFWSILKSAASFNFQGAVHFNILHIDGIRTIVYAELCVPQEMSWCKIKKKKTQYHHTYSAPSYSGVDQQLWVSIRKLCSHRKTKQNQPTSVLYI